MWNTVAITTTGDATVMPRRLIRALQGIRLTALGSDPDFDFVNYFTAACRCGFSLNAFLEAIAS